ncbi:MAG: class I SAM-dependent methyltransferase, partial [Desulfurococcales archaeon]|nr:class I SAM-dependent methyltransferase [Desulfurococcales archaeon]
VDRDGRVIDLGCGNGLLLRHLVSQAGKKLEPYGVDFIEESIEQAKTVILPEYAENFAVSNLVDYSLKPGSFDFILVDPYDIHRDDLEGFLEMVLGACRPGGRVIFYTYRDVLRVLLALSIVALLLPPLRKRLPHRIYGVARSVKNLFPPHIASRLKTIEHRHVSIGVYECTKEASPRAFQP